MNPNLITSTMRENITTRRTQLGLSQGQLAVEAGVSETTVRRVERGEVGRIKNRTRRGLHRSLRLRRWWDLRLPTHEFPAKARMAEPEGVCRVEVPESTRRLARTVKPGPRFERRGLAGRIKRAFGRLFGRAA